MTKTQSTNKLDTMHESELFTVYRLSDLPETLREQIKCSEKMDELSRKILSLFDKKAILDLDQIQVGLYRAYKLETERSKVSTQIVALIKKKLVEYYPGRRGVYKKAGVRNDMES